VLPFSRSLDQDKHAILATRRPFFFQKKKDDMGVVHGVLGSRPSSVKNPHFFRAFGARGWTNDNQRFPCKAVSDTRSVQY